MTSTSGIVAILGLVIISIIAFEWGAQKEFEDRIDAPTELVTIENPRDR